MPSLICGAEVSGEGATYVPVPEFLRACESEVLLILAQFDNVRIDDERLELGDADLTAELLLQHFPHVGAHQLDPLRVHSLLAHQTSAFLPVLPE